MTLQSWVPCEYEYSTPGYLQLVTEIAYAKLLCVLATFPADKRQDMHADHGRRPRCSLNRLPNWEHKPRSAAVERWKTPREVTMR